MKSLSYSQHDILCRSVPSRQAHERNTFIVAFLKHNILSITVEYIYTRLPYTHKNRFINPRLPVLWHYQRYIINFALLLPLLTMLLQLHIHCIPLSASATPVRPLRSSPLLYQHNAYPLRCANRCVWHHSMKV